MNIFITSRISHQDLLQTGPFFRGGGQAFGQLGVIQVGRKVIIGLSRGIKVDKRPPGACIPVLAPILPCGFLETNKLIFLH